MEEKKDLLSEAYFLLMNAECPYETRVKYTARFKSFNSNIRLCGNKMEVRLSKDFKKVSKEIIIGMIQELLIKILRIRKKGTLYIDLYNNFVKSLHLSANISHQEPTLVDSFNRVNEKYFQGQIEMPNLVFCDGFRELGAYEYKTDTIRISRILLKRTDLMDYVMYHEMLHKKHKFYVKNGRTFHHTRKFKEDEKKYPNQEQMEKELSRFLTIHRLKRMFF